MKIVDLLYRKEAESFVVIDDADTWDIFKLRNRVFEISTFLKNAGVSKNDRVAIIINNNVNFICAMFAVLSLEAVVIPISNSISSTIVKSMLKSVEAKFIYLSKENKLTVDNYNKFNETEHEMILISQDNYDNCSLASDICFILFSSGTYSSPKGVMLSNEAIYNNVCSIVAYMKPSIKDVFFVLKSVVHISTIVGEILVACYIGATIVLRKVTVTPHILLHRIEIHKATILIANPSIYRMLLRGIKPEYNMDTVRLIYTLAATADKDTLMRLETAFPNANVLNVYGLTEAGPRVTAQIAGHNSEYGSVGKAIDGVKIKIMNQNNEVTEINKTGIVWVKTKSMMSGYYKMESETNKVLYGDWLITGDIGYYDVNNELHIVGRSDDMFTRGGHNINPIHIENILKEHLDIENCIVFGAPDQLLGSRIICVFEEKCKSKFTKVEVYSICNAYLMQNEKPDEIYYWDDLPSTITSKISRRKALEQYIKNKNG